MALIQRQLRRRPQVFQTIFHGVDDPETLVDLTPQDEPGISGDGGPLKIDHDGLFKIRPDYLFLAFTTSEHLENPRNVNLSSLISLSLLES